MAHAEDARRLLSQHEQMFCSLDTDGGPGMGGAGPPGSVASFHPAGAAGGSQTFRGDDDREHLNLLGWNGHSASPHLFPQSGAAPEAGT